MLSIGSRGKLEYAWHVETLRERNASLWPAD